MWHFNVLQFVLASLAGWFMLGYGGYKLFSGKKEKKEEVIVSSGTVKLPSIFACHSLELYMHYKNSSCWMEDIVFPLISLLFYLLKVDSQTSITRASWKNCRITIMCKVICLIINADSSLMRLTGAKQ